MTVPDGAAAVLEVVQALISSVAALEVVQAEHKTAVG